MMVAAAEQKKLRLSAKLEYSIILGANDPNSKKRLNEIVSSGGRS
jgi:hypothetical protein